MPIVVALPPRLNAFSGQNGDVVPLLVAMPVAQPTTTLMRASASSGFALATVIGLVITGAGLALPARVVPNGVVTLPAATWDAVTGGVGGLVPGAYYWLDAASLGMLATAPPSTPGQYVTLIGSAVSALTLLLHPEPPILL